MKTKVSIVRTIENDTESLRDVIRRSMDLLDSPLSDIGPQTTVVIKPNITAQDVPWQTGVVTNPNLVHAVVEEVLKQNPKEVLIAEAIAVGLNVKKAYSFYGYDVIAEKTGAKLIDLYDEEFIRVPVPKGELNKSMEVSRTVMEAGFHIVIPVIKTHVATDISVCMKCLMGTISKEQKKRFHFFGLAQSILELNTVVKPDLLIADGTIAGQGNGPMANEPVDFRTLITGTDSRSVDVVTAGAIGFDPDSVDILQRASEQWGPLTMSEIDIAGEPLKGISRTFDQAVSSTGVWEGIQCIDGNACGACAGVIQLALKRAQGMGFLEDLRSLRILTGPDARPVPGEERTLLVGKCLSHLKNEGRFVPGCPPQVFLVADELREMIGLNRTFGCKEEFMF